MKAWRRFCRVTGVALVGGLHAAGIVHAATPEPMSLAAVVQTATARRAEIVAARARADALAERPAIVGALEDPVIAPAIDHYPFEMMTEDEAGGRRYDWSISIEQRLPLSPVRTHRRDAARAEAARARAEAERIELDVVLGAQRAFFMLRERRRMADVVAQQLALARELVASAAARYAAGRATQSDVLRGEVELARAQAVQRALEAETRGAQAMLNVSIGREPGAPIGPLQEPGESSPVPSAAALVGAAHRRPELRAGEAELERAGAEIAVMRAMYRPMLMVRAGRASTMVEGPGAMLMVGVSVPLWRGKLRAGVAEARAMERMAQADLEAMRRMVEGEVADAAAQLEAAEVNRQALASDVVPRAQAAVDSALSTYAAGQATLISVVEASRALWDTRNELVMAERTVGEARARLERAMGGPRVEEPLP